MKFGINTFLFTSPFTNRSTRLFAKFKRWGFDGVEIAVEDTSHLDAAFVRSQLNKHALVCTSVCACFPPQRDLRGTRSQQLATIRYLKELIRMADVLGTDIVMGPLYSATGRADAVPPAEYRKQWRTVRGHLKTICRHAEDNGKIICMEPLNRFETDFLNTVDQGLKMISEVDSPALKLLLDTFHMNIEEKNPADAIRRAGRHVGHIHASASDRGTPGNDHVDWAGIARALRDIRYNGTVVIESFTTDVKVIARAAAIWRKIEPSRDRIAADGLLFLKKTMTPAVRSRHGKKQKP
ncbi:MAG TPA: sugar phosphate isomerase/epimerase [Verrucomicrobiota bacterium]|nr:sugar phosphate isomerase/epimerase [Verrucomicrobiota bacterium]